LRQEERNKQGKIGRKVNLGYDKVKKRVAKKKTAAKDSSGTETESDNDDSSSSGKGTINSGSDHEQLLSENFSSDSDSDEGYLKSDPKRHAIR
jgi:hypothetical protein